MNQERRGRPAVPMAGLQVENSAFQIAVDFVYLKNFFFWRNRAMQDP